MNDDQITQYGVTIAKEFEKFMIYETNYISVLEKLIKFGNLVSGPGGLVKKINKSEVSYEYLVDHKLGLNTSKAIYSAYCEISTKYNLNIGNEQINEDFLSFIIELKK